MLTVVNVQTCIIVTHTHTQTYTTPDNFVIIEDRHRFFLLLL